MYTFTNETHIKRFARIGQFASISGLLLLGGGLFISFRQPDQVAFSLGALLLGFGVSQIGIYLGNRYARFPRPDQALGKALKGLDRNYTLYNFVSPAAHLLIGPAGIWILLAKPQRGQVTYSNGRWRQKGGFVLNYLKIFAQEGIGRPDIEVEAEVEGFKKFLAKEIPGKEFPDPQVALVFINEQAEIDAPDAPNPTLTLKELKNFIRNETKGQKYRLNPEQMQAIKEVLEAPWDVEEEEEE